MAGLHARILVYELRSRAFGQGSGINASALRVFRVFRLGRTLRALKSNREIQQVAPCKDEAVPGLDSLVGFQQGSTLHLSAHVYLAANISLLFSPGIDGVCWERGCIFQQPYLSGFPPAYVWTLWDEFLRQPAAPLQACVASCRSQLNTRVPYRVSQLLRLPVPSHPALSTSCSLIPSVCPLPVYHTALPSVMRTSSRPPECFAVNE